MNIARSSLRRLALAAQTSYKAATWALPGMMFGPLGTQRPWAPAMRLPLAYLWGPAVYASKSNVPLLTALTQQR